MSLAWLTWGLLASLVFVGVFQRVAPAVMADELMRDFSITATLFGNLSAIYFLCLRCDADSQPARYSSLAFDQYFLN